jgi:hypothetical protein
MGSVTRSGWRVSSKRRPLLGPKGFAFTACQWHAVTSRHDIDTGVPVETLLVDSWNDLATAGTRSKGKEKGKGLKGTATTFDPPSIHLGVGSERPLSQRVNRPRATRPAGTYQTPEFLNSKAGEFLSTSSRINPKLFPHKYMVHAVGHRPHTALACLPGIYLCTRTGWVIMVDGGSVKHLWATTGVSTHRQEARARVVGSSRCSRLASAPPWGPGAIPTADPPIR